MGFSQFVNSLQQIRRSRHTRFLPAVFRHVAWLGRRAFNVFPVEVQISRSRVIVDRHSGVAALVNCLGMYDYNNMSLIVSVLANMGEGAWFFDVGANIGAYTLVASEVSTAHVASFEPGRMAFRALKTNVRANNRENVVLYNLALSDKPGLLNLTEGDESSLDQVVENSAGHGPIIQVEATTLDDICERLGCVPIVIKIDVEGHEGRVLRGFSGNFGTAGMIVVEGGALESNRQILAERGFDGPWYHDALSKTFRRLPLLREEDPLFVTGEFRRRLEQWGNTFVP